MNRNLILIATLILLGCAVCSGGCLSGTTAPGPATAVVPSLPADWLPVMGGEAGGGAFPPGGEILFSLT
ncbi:MAG TPA: hypothetical protein PLG75_11275 [Methanoculleus sp.]|nr:hypothetical protein [Methanoculleus sp.]